MIESNKSFLNLKNYPSRTKREIRLIDKSPFGDKDRDRVPNIFDCKPLDKKRQDWGTQEIRNIKPRIESVQSEMKEANEEAQKIMGG